MHGSGKTHMQYNKINQYINITYLDISNQKMIYLYEGIFHFDKLK